MEKTSYASGTPSWIDLGTTDIPGAAAFYSSLFGWEVVDQGPEAGGYCMLEIDGKPVAGLGPAQQPGRPTWTTYFTVDNADDTAQRTTEAGGTVVAPPFDVFDSGRMAVCLDPTGAPFAVWQPMKHIGAHLINEPGTLTWSQLDTRDEASAAAFYQAVLGLQARPIEGSEPAYSEWFLGDEAVAGMMPIDDSWPADTPSQWMTYFNVESADATVARVLELGGLVFAGPFPAGPGIIAVVQDPQGGVFAIIEITEEM